MKEILVESIGWSRVGAVEDRGRATLTVRPGDDGTTVVGIMIEPYEPDPAAPSAPRPVNIETSVTLAPNAPAGRKLRRLATFARDQKRIPEEMDVQDELRAMEVLAKTLDSLDEETSSRVLSWLTARAQAADLKRLGRGAQETPMRTGFATIDAEESVRRAKERVTS